MIDIEKLKELDEKVLSGAWEFKNVSGHANFSQVIAREGDMIQCVSADIGDAEAELTCELRNALPDIISLSSRVSELEEALSAAIGYMMNARIDLETGCPKATAIKTITGGINRAKQALVKHDQALPYHS